MHNMILNTRNLFLMLLAFICTLSANADLKPRFNDDTPASVKIRMMNEFSEMRKSARTPYTVGSRETAPLKSFGSPKIPVVLVQFADLKFTISSADSVNYKFDLFSNGTRNGVRYTGAGSYGSVRDYFAAQSDSIFLPEFVVIGPVTLNEGYAYYGKNSGNTKDVNISKFYNEAITEVTKMGIDWKNFDNDGDGIIDMVYFIYAGVGENDSQNNDPYVIWPKEGGSGKYGGWNFGACACSNELFRGQLDGIGPMCHELSHALGLPDFYDVKYVAYGLDYWDIMDSGCYCSVGQCPCNYSAYEREFMGWGRLVTLDAGIGQNVTVYPIDDSRGVGYKIVNNENPNEYYVVENRQNSGWDRRIGFRSGNTYGLNHGLMVTHIQFVEGRWTGNNVNTDPKHQLITLIPADSTLHSTLYVNQDRAWSMEENIYVTGYDADFCYRSAAGDLYPGITGKTDLQGRKAFVYSDTGETPHMMNQPITDIEEHEDGSITFKFCGGDLTYVKDIRYSGRNTDEGIFDMQGRRVSFDKNQLKRGFYIINGRKALVK